jgi:DNA ligase (NAD+)
MAEPFVVSSFASHNDELNYLTELGFAVNPLNKSKLDINQVYNYAEEIVEKRDELAYMVDGVVVKLDDNKLVEQLEIVGKAPRAWAAIKFPAGEVVTKVINVEWSVGRTGRVTPVAVLEPRDIQGSTVSRATLHNAAEVKAKDIHIGDSVVLRKAGDVIPEIVQVIRGLRQLSAIKIILPTRCPSCDSILEWTETDTDLVCNNTQDCTQQQIDRLVYFTSRNIANIVGLSTAQLEWLNKERGVKDITDIYELDLSTLENIEGYGAKSINNLQDSINNSRKIEIQKFIAGLSIDGVGVEVAKLISNILITKIK